MLNLLCPYWNKVKLCWSRSDVFVLRLISVLSLRKIKRTGWQAVPIVLYFTTETGIYNCEVKNDLLTFFFFESLDDKL